MRKIYKLKIKRGIIEILLTIIGAFILAIGISLFLLPNKLSSGGITGVATIFYYLFKFPMGIVILVINIPLFLFGMFKVGKYFFVKSIIGTISLSIFVELLEKIQPVTNDKLLACIYGGTLIGIGTALLLKVNSSTGGSDLVSYIVKDYNPNIVSGKIIMMMDIGIIVLNMIFLGEIEIGLYSAIAIYIMGKVIDILFEGVYFTKLLLIISDKGPQIANRIEKDIKRGITGLYGKGMHTNYNKIILMCAANRKDISNIKKIAKEIDKSAFIIITNSREVLGLGFKRVN